MPPRISSDDFDTDPASNIDDDSLDESTAQLHPQPETKFTASSVQIALIISLPVRLRIVQLLSNLHSELMDTLHVCGSRVKDGDGSTPFHRNMLDYLIRRFIIPLHYSFSNQAHSNPLFHYSLKLSLDAALAMISPEPDRGFQRLIASGGGVFREGVRCATVAISLELVTQLETQRPNSTMQRTRQYRDFLKQAARHLISLSEKRIRRGETNVKTHMFLNMVLAQVEAVEAGELVAWQVARAARDSLELCDTVLKTREDANSSMPSPDDAALAAAGMEGVEAVGVQGFGPDFEWQSFFPDAGLGHGWLEDLDS